jgi:hypothetical protein
LIELLTLKSNDIQLEEWICEGGNTTLAEWMARPVPGPWKWFWNEMRRVPLFGVLVLVAAIGLVGLLYWILLLPPGLVILSVGVIALALAEQVMPIIVQTRYPKPTLME